jgi:hypothetical protein
MQFYFYIVNKSFTYQNSIGKEDLESKIKSFAIDYNHIRQYKDSEKIFVNPTIYEETIYPGFSVCDFLYNQDSKKYFDRDTISYLNTIIDKSVETTFTTEEIIENLLPTHTSESVHGLMCLHEVQGIDNLYLIYNKNNWFDFHRHFLGLYPHDSDFFLSECEKYLPELYIHKSNIDTIRKILNNSAITIIHHLKELNNNYNKCKDSTTSRIDLLRMLNSMSDFELDASIEGDITRKRYLSFIFLNEKGLEETIYCELHLKLLHNDLRKIEQNRIYFHESKSNIERGKILIGYIGVHL